MLFEPFPCFALLMCVVLVQSVEHMQKQNRTTTRQPKPCLHYCSGTRVLTKAKLRKNISTVKNHFYLSYLNLLLRCVDFGQSWSLGDDLFTKKNCQGGCWFKSRLNLEVEMSDPGVQNIVTCCGKLFCGRTIQHFVL